MKIDVNNFETYTEEEYLDNLQRLNIDSYSSLVGKKVYYSKPSYGEHIVVMWNADRGEYLLSLDGQKFWSSPFSILIIQINKK